MKTKSGAVLLTKGTSIDPRLFGSRAERLARLIDLGLPVPKTVAISMHTVHEIATGRHPDAKALFEPFGKNALVSVRSSPGDAKWGRANTVFNVGMSDSTAEHVAVIRGKAAATKLYSDFVRHFAVEVARLDPESFEGIAGDPSEPEFLATALKRFEREGDSPFPQSASLQLASVLRSMARAWEGTTARLLRRAHGAPDDAGLGLVIQEMVLGRTGEECGAGALVNSHPETGSKGLYGTFHSELHGKCEIAATEIAEALPCKSIFQDAKDCLDKLRTAERDACEIEFSVADGKLRVLDYKPAERTVGAAIAISVGLAKDNIIAKQDALTRMEPDSLGRILHKQVAKSPNRRIVAKGIGASPGGASGAIVFSSSAAADCAARNESCILVRVETGPEDIRGMYTAKGVLTGRGGVTSHAAVIARGLGVPCVAGASDLHFDQKEQLLTASEGQVFREGDLITVDGTRGEVLKGATKLVEPMMNEEVDEFLDWADEHRDLVVRANADTSNEARVARRFKADGIGLCRTEHMFFGEARLTVMREMIFADSAEERRSALDQLLDMQRSEFESMFEIMEGSPVCVRLFDPPLHEFLPHDRDEMQELAEALDLPISKVIARAEELREFNPMLGLRGVRLGVTVPEIYEMQARAIFEAAVNANEKGGSIIPEIMVPLVSAHREMELVRKRVDLVAQSVKAEFKVDFEYSIGVMVETPRAALRAGDLASESSFLSFGTNDLTQMTYGISRDDSQRFMEAYLEQGVFPLDPFSSLDLEGVGELLLTAAQRGRASKPELVLAICGEHGGDPSTIEFCRDARFTYVSCSPYRVPIARLAAAQAAIRSRSG